MTKFGSEPSYSEGSQLFSVSWNYGSWWTSTVWLTQASVAVTGSGISHWSWLPNITPQRPALC